MPCPAYMKGFEMEYPQMVYNGKLTEAGQEIVTYIEGMITSAMEGVSNRAEGVSKLPGHIQHYYVNVLGTKTETKEEFVENYERSSIRYAWNDMVWFQEQAQQAETVDKTAEQTSELAEALESLREELAAVRKELSIEKGRVTKLSNRLSEQDETVTDETDDDKPEDEAAESTDDEQEEAAD